MTTPLRTRMISNAHAYNTNLTPEKLAQMTTKELLANCHPLDRIDFIKELVATEKQEVENDNV